MVTCRLMNPACRARCVWCFVALVRRSSAGILGCDRAGQDRADGASVSETSTTTMAMLVLQEKQRIAQHAFEALRQFGEHEDDCPSWGGETCECAFGKCLDEWRAAADGVE